MSVTDFFRRLGAPLVNPQWSWGAQRPSDGAVFLRVWQNEKLVENGRLHFLILSDIDAARASARLGYTERLKHIEAVRSGAPCFLVVIIAKDIAASPRKIADFHDEYVFVGEELVERNGSLWVKVAGRKPVSEVTK